MKYLRLPGRNYRTISSKDMTPNLRRLPKSMFVPVAEATR
jgi:hypothetical protein